MGDAVTTSGKHIVRGVYTSTPMPVREIKSVRRLAAQDRAAASKRLAELYDIYSGDRVNYLYLRGCIESDAEEYWNARRSFEEALVLAPKYTKLVAEYLYVLYILDDYVTAFDLYDNLTGRQQKRLRIRQQMGYMYRWIGWRAKERQVSILRDSEPWFKRTVWRVTDKIRLRWESGVAREFSEFRIRLDPLASLVRISPSTESLVGSFNLFLLAVSRSWMINGVRWRVVSRTTLTTMLLLVIAADYMRLTRLAASNAYIRPLLAGAAFLPLYIVMARKVQRNDSVVAVTRRAIVPFSAFVGVGWLLLLAHRPTREWYGSVGLGILAVIPCLMIGYVLSRVDSSIDNYKDQRSCNAEPRCAILALALEIEKISRDARVRSSASARYRILFNLEFMARILINGPIREASFYEPKGNEWFKNRMIGAAEWVRSLKRGIVSGSDDDWVRLHRAMKTVSSCASTGAWTRLPNRDPEEASKPGRVKRMQRIVTVALAAFLPAAAFYLLDPIVQFGDEVAKWAKLVVFGWALLSILFHLDPKLREKVDVAREVVSALRPPNESKKVEPEVRDRH